MTFIYRIPYRKGIVQSSPSLSGKYTCCVVVCSLRFFGYSSEKRLSLGLKYMYGSLRRTRQAKALRAELCPFQPRAGGRETSNHFQTSGMLISWVRAEPHRRRSRCAWTNGSKQSRVSTSVSSIARCARSRMRKYSTLQICTIWNHCRCSTLAFAKSRLRRCAQR